MKRQISMKFNQRMKQIKKRKEEQREIKLKNIRMLKKMKVNYP